MLSCFLSLLLLCQRLPVYVLCNIHMVEGMHMEGRKGHLEII